MLRTVHGNRKPDGSSILGDPAYDRDRECSIDVRCTCHVQEMGVFVIWRVLEKPILAAIGRVVLPIVAGGHVAAPAQHRRVDVVDVACDAVDVRADGVPLRRAAGRELDAANR